MGQPTPYTRQSDFTDFSTDHPDEQQPGAYLDAELNAVKTTLDAILANLALIQRDDGDLANRSVGLDQMKAEVSLGVNAATDWLTATDYAERDAVWHSYVLYLCEVAHTSGTFATDLANGDWSVLVDLATPLASASTSATAAAASATSAGASATTATTQAGTATTQAGIATAQAVLAAASAVAAAASAASISDTFTTQSASYSAAAAAHDVVDTTAADKTVTMPASPAAGDHPITLRKIGLFTMTVDFGSKKLLMPDGSYATGQVDFTGQICGDLRFIYVGTLADGTTNVWVM